MTKSCWKTFIFYEWRIVGSFTFWVDCCSPLACQCQEKKRVETFCTMWQQAIAEMISSSMVGCCDYAWFPLVFCFAIHTAQTISHFHIHEQIPPIIDPRKQWCSIRQCTRCYASSRVRRTNLIVIFGMLGVTFLDDQNSYSILIQAMLLNIGRFCTCTRSIKESWRLGTL